MAVEVIKQFAISFKGLVDQKSFDQAETAVNQVSDRFLSVTRMLGAALVTGSFAMALRETANRFDSLGDAATRMGNVTVEELDRFGFVAEMAGSDAQTAQASIEGLSRAIGEAANGVGRGAQAFEKFGLSARNSDGTVKSVSQVIDDLRGKLDGLSQAEQSAMIQRLGMDRTMLEVLTSDTTALEAEYNKRMELLGLNADEVASVSAEFNDGIGRMSRSFNDLFTAIAARIMPAVTDVFETFSRWIIENGDGILEVLSPFVTALEVAIRVVRNLVETVLDFASALGPVHALVAGIATAWKTINVVFAMSPIGRVVTAITALISVIGLLKNDFDVAMKGGKSFFSFWVPLVDTINAVSDAISNFYGYLENSGALQNFADSFSNVFGFVESVVQTFSGFLQTALGGVVALFTGNTEMLSAAWDNLFDGMKGVVENFVAFFSKIFGGISKVAKGLFNFFSSSDEVDEANNGKPKQGNKTIPDGLNAAVAVKNVASTQAIAPSSIHNQTTTNTTNTRNLSQTINVSSSQEAKAIAVETARVYGGAQ